MVRLNGIMYVAEYYFETLIDVGFSPCIFPFPFHTQVALRVGTERGVRGTEWPKTPSYRPEPSETEQLSRSEKRREDSYKCSRYVGQKHKGDQTPHYSTTSRVSCPRKEWQRTRDLRPLGRP